MSTTPEKRKFEVGDVVAKFEYNWELVIRKVVKSFKRYVVLSDGSKYSHGGHECHSGYISSYITIASPEHLEAFRKKLKWGKIEKKFNELKGRRGEMEMGVLNSLLQTLENISNQVAAQGGRWGQRRKTHIHGSGTGPTSHNRSQRNKKHGTA